MNKKEQTHKGINERTNKQMDKNKWTYKWTDESYNKLMNQRIQK